MAKSIGPTVKKRDQTSADSRFEIAPLIFPKTALPAPISSLGAFLKDAEAIFEAAEAAAESASNFANLIGPKGGIHMVADSDWLLAPLELNYIIVPALPTKSARQAGILLGKGAQAISDAVWKRNTRMQSRAGCWRLPRHPSPAST